VVPRVSTVAVGLASQGAVTGDEVSVAALEQAS